MELDFDYDELDLRAIDAIEQDYLERRAEGPEPEAVEWDESAFEAAALAAVVEAEAAYKGFQTAKERNRSDKVDSVGIMQPLAENTDRTTGSQAQKQKTLDCYWTSSVRSQEGIKMDSLQAQPSQRRLSPSNGQRGGIYSSIFRREREKRRCHVQVDHEAALVWIYPSHPPVRDYQYSMVRTALFDNTLVCLPTGLGKTLIAAVVMYNFYRWFPGGKVLFMAPTRPLVSQQIDACWKIMGIPKEDTTELTGQTKALERVDLWERKRVFYLTPQVLENDLRQGICPAQKVVCVVMDEAHRAQGNYAYVAAARLLAEKNACYRMLALSATPGSSYSEIQSVISNLSIAKVEFRSEEDPDVSKYCHHREIRVVEVQQSDHLSNASEVLLDGLLRPIVKKLVSCGVYYKTNVESIGRFSYLQAQKAFRAKPPEGLPQSRYAEIELRFQQALRLASVHEQLEKYGIETALQAIEEGIRGPLGRLYREEPCFRQLKAMLQGLVKGEIVHPKIERVQSILVEHFHGGDRQDTAGRVIVFTNLRDSVTAICKAVNSIDSAIRAEQFIGQGVGGKSGRKGQTQKEQREILERFRRSEFQVLVATSIGEEGLDIPDVDLIICYDSSASPTRHIQRMGRTGRFRQGMVVVICAKGKERQDYEANLDRTKKLHRQLRRGGQSFSFCSSESLFMLPVDPTPMLLDLCTPEKQNVRRGNGKHSNSHRSHIDEFERAAKISSLRPLSLKERAALQRTSAMKMQASLPSLIAWPASQASLLPAHNVAHAPRTRDFVSIMGVISRHLRRAGPGPSQVDGDALAECQKVQLYPSPSGASASLEPIQGQPSVQGMACRGPNGHMLPGQDSDFPASGQAFTHLLGFEHDEKVHELRSGASGQPCSKKHVSGCSVEIGAQIEGEKPEEIASANQQTDRESSPVMISLSTEVATRHKQHLHTSDDLKGHLRSKEPAPGLIKAKPPHSRAFLDATGCIHAEDIQRNSTNVQKPSLHVQSVCPGQVNTSRNGRSTVICHPPIECPESPISEGPKLHPRIGLTQDNSKASPLTDRGENFPGVQDRDTKPDVSPGLQVSCSASRVVCPSLSLTANLEDSLPTATPISAVRKPLKRLRKACDLGLKRHTSGERVQRPKQKLHSKDNKNVFIDDEAGVSSEGTDEDMNLDRDLSGLIDDRDTSQYTPEDSRETSSPTGQKGNPGRDMLAVYRRTLLNVSPILPGQTNGRRNSLPAFQSPPRSHPNPGFAKMGRTKTATGSPGNNGVEHSSINVSDRSILNSRDTGQHLDYCAACLGDGEVILCDGCPAAYHLACVGLHHLPAGRWFCIQCSKVMLGCN